MSAIPLAELAAASTIFLAACGGQIVGAPCQEDRSACPNGCFDLLADPQNCGACGTACGVGESCIDGECRLCPIGLSECDGDCVDPEGDPENCGGCGIECGSLETCSGGVCVLECPSELDECAGACVDTMTDEAHCGGCDSPCEPGWTCEAGVCEIDCPKGTSECGDECVDTMEDEDHCGGCWVECGDGELCVSGECELQCGGGLVACGDECVDVTVDPENCGACGNACNTDEECVDGACEPVCDPGLVACGDACVDTEIDPENCGACGVVCPAGVCNAGECAGEMVGHLVAIGHDYMLSHTMMRRLLGNAVFMTPGNPVEVLAYEEHSDNGPSGQAARVDLSISMEAAFRGRTWQKTSAPDAQFVVDHLLGQDILLIYRQSEADDAELESAGGLMADVMTSFLWQGGTIVFTDGPGAGAGTYVLLNEAGLFSCNGIATVSGGTAEIVDFGDAVAQGVSDSYLASSNSVSFDTAEGQVVVDDQETSAPIVVHKIFLPE